MNNFLVLQVKLAEHLVESSFADKVLFANSSTQGNETEIKLAREYQQTLRTPKEENATEFIYFMNCFHG